MGTLLAACGGGGPSPATAPVTAPVTPSTPYAIPAGVWRPASSVLPATGNYIYTESDATDYIGAGHSYTYTDQNSLLSVTASGIGIKLSVKGAQRWSGEIAVPNTLPGLQTGYFKDVTRPGNDPAKGALDWGGEGRGCNRLTGWVVIDKVTIANNIVTELDLSFEQHCEGQAPATRARVHWTLANANAVVPASPSPIPPTLWRADPALLPASDSYVYLSGVQDANGAWHDRLYTRSNANIGMDSFEGHARLIINGDQTWSADFATMEAVKRIQVGYYPNMTYYPLNNPLFGGLRWNGENRNCFGMTGWFVVDAVTYAGDQISELDLRFEQACAGATTTLHGQIRWRAGETPVVVGPAFPVPTGLWAPPSNFVAPAGNYVYLSSETAVSVAPFNTVLPLTDLNYVSENTIPPSAWVSIAVNGYQARFVGIQGLAQLVPGYYAGLKDFPNMNRTKGGFELTGNGTTCFRSLGWVVVEHAAYAQGELTALDLRFETTCEGSRDIMHGVIHWLKPQ